MMWVQISLTLDFPKMVGSCKKQLIDELINFKLKMHRLKYVFANFNSSFNLSCNIYNLNRFYILTLIIDSILDAL